MVNLDEVRTLTLLLQPHLLIWFREPIYENWLLELINKQRLLDLLLLVPMILHKLHLLAYFIFF